MNNRIFPDWNYANQVIENFVLPNLRIRLIPDIMRGIVNVTLLDFHQDNIVLVNGDSIVSIIPPNYINVFESICSCINKWIIAKILVRRDLFKEMLFEPLDYAHVCYYEKEFERILNSLIIEGQIPDLKILYGFCLGDPKYINFRMPNDLLEDFQKLVYNF